MTTHRIDPINRWDLAAVLQALHLARPDWTEPLQAVATAFECKFETEVTELIFEPITPRLEVRPLDVGVKIR